MAAATYSPVLIRSMAVQKPLPSAAKTVSSKKNTTVFPLGEGPRTGYSASTSPVRLLTRVEQLRLLSKAEKAGLLSAAEKFGLSLSVIERLGLLSKAEDFGVLSTTTDPGTPSNLLGLSLFLLALGPASVYFVPEDYPWQIGLQIAVAAVSVVAGSAAFAVSNLLSSLINPAANLKTVQGNVLYIISVPKGDLKPTTQCFPIHTLIAQKIRFKLMNRSILPVKPKLIY